MKDWHILTLVVVFLFIAFTISNSITGYGIGDWFRRGTVTADSGTPSYEATPIIPADTARYTTDEKNCVIVCGQDIASDELNLDLSSMPDMGWSAEGSCYKICRSSGMSHATCAKYCYKQ